MSRGRPPKGAELAQGLEGSSAAKDRLEIILQSIAGTISVVDACHKLGVSEARFHELRTGALQAASQALEPKPKGRPPAAPPGPLAQEIAGLREEVFELK